jgi:hypothetical protein
VGAAHSNHEQAPGLKKEPVMRISSSPLPSVSSKYKAAIAAALVSFAATLPSQSREPSLPPGCEAIQVPEGNKVSMHAYAVGFQIYLWNVTTSRWDFVAPAALLFADPGGHGIIGVHFAGPTWMSNSGSSVIGARIASCVPDPSAIPWLLLGTVHSQGPGPLDQTTFIQRVNTTGGVAPARAGLPNETVRVPYTAEYYFYRDQ